MKLPGPLRGSGRRLLARAVGTADGRLVQTGALPWRRDGDGGVEILLVTGRGSGRWMVPKGWPMRGRSLAEAAAQEAWEEAGVLGRIGDRPLGHFQHRKNHRLLGPLTVSILLHPLEVEREAAEWPERGQRARRWFGAEAAARAVRSRALARLIGLFAEAAADGRAGTAPPHGRFSLHAIRGTDR